MIAAKLWRHPAIEEVLPKKDCSDIFLLISIAKYWIYMKASKNIMKNNNNTSSHWIPLKTNLIVNWLFTKRKK